MSLGETVVYCGLGGLFFVGTSLSSLHEYNIFGARTDFSMDACHIFPHYSGHYSFDGDVTGVVVTKDCTGY